MISVLCEALSVGKQKITTASNAHIINIKLIIKTEK